MKKFILLLALHFSLFTLCRAQYPILLNFNGTNGADSPFGSLTLSGSKLYGMTQAGGSTNGGVIFSIDTNGNGYKKLFDFNFITDPGGLLTLKGKVLYGMTGNGGAYNAGYIFSIDTNGNGYKDLFDFNGTNGGGAYGNSLTLSGSKLFGMTTYGGAYNPGCIFSIDINGTGYKDLLDFNTTNGAHPYSSLTLSGSVMYGMTFQGGTNGDGCVFSIDTNGNGYKKLLDFNGANGANPTCSLTLSGNMLYGMTSAGGAYGKGCIFSMDTVGSGFKDLLDFNGTIGPATWSSLALSEGVLYGEALGGIHDSGFIFSIDTSGNGYKDLFDFNGTNGQYPEGGLTLSGSVMYGITYYGGMYNDGVVFKIDTNIPTSINVLKATTEAINVYPNPSTGKFNLVISGQWVVGSEMRVEVYNVLGERVFNQLVISNEQLVINISGQPNGVYFYRVVTESGGLVGEGKVVIEK